jgi:glutamate/tyrosine decarboxylase-like PLP-dependent enzyme
MGRGRITESRSDYSSWGVGSGGRRLAPDALDVAGAPVLDPGDVERLSRRAEALLPLGTLAAERAEAGEAEREALAELVARLADNYPFHLPHYAGQMLKPPHPVAWAAYAVAMLLNPNNHALDGGPATARLERECVDRLAAILGVAEPHLGHLTSSGTIANLEALWVARELRPGEAVLSGENAHYTHERIGAVLGLAHETLPQDELGRLDPGALETRLAAGGVGTVVATLGTTSLGALDDVGSIADLCAEHGARLHVDAAYGGFFAAVEPLPALARADSIVVDPHKHGLQPYGCGCVLFADPSVGRLYAHDSPYTYFTSGDLHLGEISLECSRAGAAAAALWTTLRAVPLGERLAASREAALRVAADDRYEVVVEPQLDIVCPFARRESAAEVTAATERAFDSLAAAGWHLAKLRVDTSWLRRRHPWVEPDADTVTVLRSCLMKPEHLDTADELAGAIAGALG